MYVGSQLQKGGSRIPYYPAGRHPFHVWLKNFNAALLQLPVLTHVAYIKDAVEEMGLTAQLWSE